MKETLSGYMPWLSSQNSSPDSAIHISYDSSQDKVAFSNRIDALGPNNVDQKDKNGYTLLHKALYHGKFKLVEKLIATGANPLLTGHDNGNFLRFLAESPNRAEANKIFKFLLEKDPKVKKWITNTENIKTEEYIEYIRLAAIHQHHKLAKELLSIHPYKDFIQKELIESTFPKKEAAREFQENNQTIIDLDTTLQELKYSKEKLKKLLEDVEKAKANITSTNKGSTEHQAAILLHDSQEKALKIFSENIGCKSLKDIDTEIARIEKQKEKSKGEKDEAINTYAIIASEVFSLHKDTIILQNNLLKSAIKLGDSTRVEILLKSASVLGSSNHYNIKEEGKTVLNSALKELKETQEKLKLPDSTSSEAARKQHLDKIKGIYSSIQRIVEQPDFDLKSALDYKSKDQKNLLLQTYIDYKESASDQDPATRHQKELFFRAVFDRTETQTYLMQNSVNDKGESIHNSTELLKESAKYNDLDIYQRIVENSGNSLPSTLPNNDKNEILFYAAQSGSLDIFSSICAQSDEEYTTTFQNKTSLLMSACKGGNLKIIEEICDAKSRLGVKINQADKLGNTALHYLANSSSIDNTQTIKLLVDQGADIEATNKLGHTALMSAVMLGNVALVKELLAKGANVNAIDNDGYTPLIYAVDSNNPEVIEAILAVNELNVSHKNNKNVSAYSISVTRDLTTGYEKKNNYTDLSKILLSKGADPYKVSPTTMRNVILTDTLAIVAIKGSNLLADAVKGTWFSGIGGVLRTITTVGALYAVGETSRTHAKEFLQNLKIDHNKKTSLEDLVMIGTIHNSRFRFKRGTSLQSDMKNKNFKDTEQGIFTKDALIEKIDAKRGDANFKEWAVTAQKSLQDKYIATKRTIQDRSLLSKTYDRLLFWREKALQENLSDIKTASELLIKESIGVVGVVKSDGSNDTDKITFDQANATLIKAITTNPKELLTYILTSHLDAKQNENVEKVKNIVQLVIDKKILVSPEAYYSFCEFEKQRKVISKNSNTQENFINANMLRTFSAPEITQEMTDYNEKLVGASYFIPSKTDSKPKPKTLLERAKDITTKAADLILTEKTIGIASTIYGIGKTALLASLLEIDKTAYPTVARIVLASGAVSTVGTAVATTAAVTGYAYNALSFSASCLGNVVEPLVTNYLIATGAVVAAVGITVAVRRYWPWNKEQSSEVQFQPITIKKSSIPDYLTEEERLKKTIGYFPFLFKTAATIPPVDISTTNQRYISAQHSPKKKWQKAAKQVIDNNNNASKTPTAAESISSLSTEISDGETVKIAARKVAAPATKLMTHIDDRQTDRDTTSDYSSRTSFSKPSQEVLATAKEVGEFTRRMSQDIPKTKKSIVSRIFGSKSRTSAE